MSSKAGSNGGSEKVICHFFLNGKCRHGDACHFSHDVNRPNSPQTVTAPPTIIINIPQGQPVYGVDVECVASGMSHNARSVAQVAVVDEWGRPVFNAYIRQEMPVLSYITELTGLTKEILETHGQPLG